MINFRVVAGSTSIKRKILLSDSSSSVGAGLSGLVYNSSGLVASYIRDGETARTAITLATASLGTWATGGFVEVDATHLKGVYEFGIPNAVLASGAAFADIYIYGAANLVPLHVHIDLEPIPANVKQISDDAAAADNLEAAADGTGYNLGGGSVIAASVTAAPGDSSGVSTLLSRLSSARAALLDEITPARMGALADWIDGGRLDLILDARLAASAYTAPDNATIAAIAGYLDTEISAIKAKTDNLPADPADQSALETIIGACAQASALATVAANVSTILGRIIGTLAAGTHNPQSGDAFARLGAPVGASISADIAGRAAPGAEMALTAAERTAVGAALGARTVGPTTQDRLMLSILAGLLAKTSGGGTSSIVLRNIADTANLATITVDANDNRTNISITWANA